MIAPARESKSDQRGKNNDKSATSNQQPATSNQTRAPENKDHQGTVQYNTVQKANRVKIQYLKQNEVVLPVDRREGKARNGAVP